MRGAGTKFVRKILLDHILVINNVDLSAKLLGLEVFLY